MTTIIPGEVRQLVDRREIEELSSRYNQVSDDGSASEFADLFTPDGVFEIVSSQAVTRWRGKAELTGISAALPKGRTVHVTTNFVVTIAGDSADQSCTLLLYQHLPERSCVQLTTGRYQDKLVRTADGWRFAVRSVTLNDATAVRMPTKPTGPAS